MAFLVDLIPGGHRWPLGFEPFKIAFYRLFTGGSLSGLNPDQTFLADTNVAAGI